VRVLLTGASSFTGAWFAVRLRAAGHEVVATIRGACDDYEGGRKRRLDWAAEAGVQFLEGASFGDERFLDAIGACDVVCHHAAEVTNYHSLDFDVNAAVASNTRNARQVFERASAVRAAFVATGSVFEQGEGLGEAPLRAFSPYGLAKGLSWEILSFWAARAGVPIGKFVIPNPFGPHEEARFCAYLMRTWAKGESAEVRTPAYVRDNIPIDLLAERYVRFVESVATTRQDLRLSPSGYVESQGRFAERFAAEVGGRLGLEAKLILAKQTEFAEPVMRTNSDFDRSGWDERTFWDSAADYYRETYCR